MRSQSIKSDAASAAEDCDFGATAWQIHIGQQTGLRQTIRQRQNKLEAIVNLQLSIHKLDCLDAFFTQQKVPAPIFYRLYQYFCREQRLTTTYRVIIYQILSILYDPASE